jgi:hypothetical protein
VLNPAQTAAMPSVFSVTINSYPSSFPVLLERRKQNYSNHHFFLTRVFGSVVVVAFQSAFHSEKYANNIFLFFKNHF